ncbi:energy transducer TonB family protein [Virgifigura deserti]|uniref:energy transducer TonB family protein n=1 Tax=Virgifigura deserti TaxID=2268457 RepID=UPI003CCBC6CA
MRNALPLDRRDARADVRQEVGNIRAPAAIERAVPGAKDRSTWWRSIAASLLFHLAVLGALNRLPIEERSSEPLLAIPVGLVGIGGAKAPTGPVGAGGSQADVTESTVSPGPPEPAAVSDSAAAPSAAASPSGAGREVKQELTPPTVIDQPALPPAVEPPWPLPERKPEPPRSSAPRLTEQSERRLSNVTALIAPVPPAEPTRTTTASSTRTAPVSDKETRKLALTTGRADSEAGGAGRNGSGDDYLERLRRWLNQFKDEAYPEAAKERKEEGTVILSFALARDGTVLSVGIRRSSGFPALDAAAMKLVREASPVPPFPPIYKEKVRQVVMPIRFSLTFFQKFF